VSTGLSDRELREQLVTDSREGWRVFVNQFTPGMLATIEHAGVREHDDVMDVYVRVCEHLAADDCARLRRHDPGKGALGAWLTVVVRRVVVDWVRSRKGRRRMFHAIEQLGDLDRRVFELRYWRKKQVSEIVELSARDLGRAVSIADVFESLERIELAMSARQRADLLAMLAREGTPASLDDEPVVSTAISADADPEQRASEIEISEELKRALAALPPEDSLIVQLLYVDGLTRRQVERALHISNLPTERSQALLTKLKGLLS
jgi:RNA polymerase sigma factor (sigma-70 family)